jgi:hypothetical protein
MRKSRAYRQRLTKYQPTRPTKVSIGERRRPEPNGQPGYLRVDTVHQGDQDGFKEVYHINAVDEVTQWETVGAVAQISEAWLIPVLEAMGSPGRFSATAKPCCGVDSASIRKGSRGRQILTFGIISWQMSFTSCLGAGVSWAPGRPRPSPTFIAASPCTPALDFDNADVQSLLTAERPNLVGNPYSGICPDGARVGSPSCWFNRSAFAAPPVGQFGKCQAKYPAGPAFAQFVPALHKDFAIAERRKVTVGVRAYNLFAHPNLGVPSNRQSPLSLGGSGDAVFKDGAGNFADNVGQVLTTVGTGRQIQLVGRSRFWRPAETGAMVSFGESFASLSPSAVDALKGRSF